MRVGEVAARAGVSVRSLRYYEEQGLLASGRTAGGQREYDEAAVERVGFIQTLYAAGLNSRAIVQLLPCVHTGIATPEMFALMARERARVHDQIVALTAARDRLDEIIERAPAATCVA